jgi:hypothetical protein
MKRLVILAALLASAMAAPASAAIVKVTFGGVISDTRSNGYPWGLDGYGNDIVGQTYSATFNFDTSLGTLTHPGGNNYLLFGPNIVTGAFTVNGHDYAPLSPIGAVYYRGTNFVYASFDNFTMTADNQVATWSKNLNSSIPFTSLSGAFGGGSGVLPGSGGLAGYDAWSVTSISVAGVPEPANWALMIAGFGLTGAAMRRRQVVRPVLA